MQKQMLLAAGAIGVGLVFMGFRSKTDINQTYLEESTGKTLDTLNSNLALSDFQINTLANQIKSQNAGNALDSIQVRTWRGLLSLEFEGQLEEKNALTFNKMQQISTDLTSLIQSVLSTRGRAISAYCKQNSFATTATVMTIETNLIKLSQLL